MQQHMEKISQACVRRGYRRAWGGGYACVERYACICCVRACTCISSKPGRYVDHHKANPKKIGQELVLTNQGTDRKERWIGRIPTWSCSLDIFQEIFLETRSKLTRINGKKSGLQRQPFLLHARTRKQEQCFGFLLGQNPSHEFSSHCVYQDGGHLRTSMYNIKSRWRIRLSLSLVRSACTLFILRVQNV